MYVWVEKQTKGKFHARNLWTSVRYRFDRLRLNERFRWIWNVQFNVQRVDVLYTYPCQGKLSEFVKGFGIRSSGKYECSLISRIAINILQLLRVTFSSLLQTMYYRNTGWQNLWPPRCDQPRCRREWGICWLKICCDPCDYYSKIRINFLFSNSGKTRFREV